MAGFFDSSQFMPHGMCLIWRTDLLALHVVSDAVIALAYFSIPIALFSFIRRRPLVEYRGVLVMFAAFILLCGATHVIGIWTLWYPDYALQGLVKSVAAIVSLATAAALWPLLPRLVALPAPSAMAAANAKLEEEIVQRRQAEASYRDLAARLEEQVEERTQRVKESLATAAKTESCFRGAFDNARHGMAIGGLDGVWTEVNQTLCTMLGYTAPELLELTWRNITHPDDVEPTAELAVKLLAGEIEDYTLPKRYLNKRGETVHTVLHVSLVRDEHAAPAFFMSSIQDISDIVELEEAVRQSEARASIVVETASDAIFELDGDGYIRDCNRSAENLVGRERGRLRSTALNDLITARDGSSVRWDQLRPGSSTRHDDLKFAVTRADGTRIPVDIHLGGTESDAISLFSAIVRDVSKHVAAEQALRAAHEDLRFHMANSPLAVIEWDREFRITYWSPAAERLFGWSSAETVGRQAHELRFVHEDDADKVVAVMNDLSRGRTVRNHNINRNYCKDGRVAHAEWFNSVQLDEQGTLTSVLSFVGDITERIEGARALMRSEAHTKAILDTAVDGIISIDPDGTVRSYNPASERIFGYAPDEVIGRNINMLMPAPYRHEHDGYLKNYLGTGERKVIGIGREVVGLRKNGESFPMELAVSEVRSDGHRTFTGFVRDISERKNFEKEIVEGNLRLQAQDWLLTGHAGLTTRLQGDLSIAEIGRRVMVFMCDYLGADAGALYVLDAAGTLSAVAGYNAAMTSVAESSGLPLSALAAQAVHEQRAMTLGGAAPASDLELVTAFGTVKLRHIVAFPIVNEDDVVAVVEFGAVHALHENHLAFLDFVNSAIAVTVASARDRERVNQLLHESLQQADVLERQREQLHTVNENLRDRGRSLEQKNYELEAAKLEIEAKAADIERANQYKSEFLANMSHELRTPLNSMLLLSRSLADNMAQTLSAEEIECARVINRSGENLLALINDILDLSKVEAGMLDIEVAPTRLEDIAQQLREQFMPVADSRKLDFDVEIETMETTVVTDPMRLQQILRNLLGNAFKFTDNGSVALRIAPDGDDVIIFEVADTGIGIATEDQTNIFDAFQQVDGSTRRRFEGTGLGLSISRELGHLLHAEWEVESTLGQGSVFRLRLPRVHPAYATVPFKVGAAQRACSPPTRAVANGTLLQGARVLIVDDDYRNSFALSRLLSENGAEVGISDSGPAALEKLAAERFDIVLMDIRMPNMNGCDAMREIRRSPDYGDIPLVALTADVSPAARAEAEAAGADDFLCKPVENAALFTILAQHMHVAA